jgi:hypothetical protein
MSRLALLISCAFVATACYVEFDAEVTGFDWDSPASLERLVQDQFANAVTTGATLELTCPAGLTGQVGNKFMCQGETSDGFLVDVEIEEDGGGAFRWLIVASRRVG